MNSFNWTFKFDQKEAALEISINDIDTLLMIIYESLERLKYKVLNHDVYNKVITAKRGLRAHEWKSIFVIYYQFHTNN